VNAGVTVDRLGASIGGGRAATLNAGSAFGGGCGGKGAAGDGAGA